MTIDDFVIIKKTNISKAIEVIDKNGHGIAFICENEVLCGVVSDGDIRRYILKKGDMSKNIKCLANNNPRYLYKKDIINSQDYMNHNKITAVPIVDDKKRIVCIEFKNGQTVHKEVKVGIPVVIMAGGKGTRLYPYTQILPKPLIPIGEKTITERIISQFTRIGCKEIFMIVNYKKNLIKAYFQDNAEIDINFIDEDVYLGTGGGLSLLKGKIGGTFFLSNCDILIEADYSDILQYHKKQKNIVTIVSVKKEFVIPYGTLEIDSKNHIVSMQEKPVFSFLTNTGFYVIEKDFLEKIEENQFIQITDEIAKYIKTGGNVGIYEVPESAWLDMGQMEELEKMRDRFNT